MSNNRGRMPCAVAGSLRAFAIFSKVLIVSNAALGSGPGGWVGEGHLTPAPASSPGDYLAEADRPWVDAKSTPQPTATLTERLKLTGAYLAISKKTYIVATGWNGFSAIAARFRDDPAWTVQEIHCGHDVAVDLPDELSALLKEDANTCPHPLS